MEETIGIDIGLNDCYVGVWRNSSVDICINEVGNYATPFMISFKGKDIYVGVAAHNELERNPKNTIYGIRKLIGKKFNDSGVQNFMKTVPYKIEKDSNNEKINVIVENNGEIKKYYPEDFYWMILQKLKEYAENFRGVEVRNVVLTIPTYFNKNQIELIKNICEDVGFKDIKIIYEPIAACIAYNFNLNNKRNILVFSMDSNELDITILKLENRDFKILGTSHDNFGEDDFIDKLLQYTINDFKESTDIDISNNKRAIKRLRRECESAINGLRKTSEYTIDIDQLMGDEDYFKDITQSTFKSSCLNLFDNCIIHIENALNNSKLNKFDIDNIIFARGSLYFPLLRETVQNFFEGKEIWQSLNSLEIYAYGATLYGNIIKNKLSLGIDKGDNIMEIIIPKNFEIPYENSITFKYYQSSINLKIYEGERKIAKYNKLLGEFPINLSLEEKNEIKVTFKLSIKGILLIEVEENGNYQSFTIEYNINIDEEKVKSIIDEAEKYEKEDEYEIKKILEIEEYKKKVYILEKENKELKENQESLKNQLILEKKTFENTLKRRNYEYEEINRNYRELIKKKKELEEELEKIKSKNKFK